MRLPREQVRRVRGPAHPGAVRMSMNMHINRLFSMKRGSLKTQVRSLEGAPTQQQPVGDPVYWMPGMNPALPPQAPSPFVARSQEPAPGPPHILLIDDSVTVRKIVEICHQRAGYHVQSFAEGVTALQWLARSREGIPPLIYLDIELPRLDGYRVAEVLRARADFARTTLIILSCRDRVTDRLKGRLSGATAYLTKPFRVQDLLATTRLYLPPPEAFSSAHQDCS